MAKFDSLKKLENFDRLRELWKLPQLKVEFGKNIVYKHGNWDGILSGALRWNGALFLFNCIFDEEDFPWPIEDTDAEDGFETTRECSRYFAVTLLNSKAIKDVIKRHVSFCMNVNPHCDYRSKKYKSNVLRDKNNWFRRKWPESQKEDCDGEVIAWFRN